MAGPRGRPVSLYERSAEMSESVTNYKCPNCGGPLHFDSASQKVICDFCGSSFDIAEIEAMYAEQNEQAAISFEEDDAAPDYLQWTEEEQAHMRAYSCPSCGAELICDVNTAATQCPYCGNPTVVPAQFTGALKPDYVIPFKLDKEAAVKKLKSFYKGKTFLPSAFVNENHIQEIKGIYVPFWLYDGTARADMSYHGTRVHTTRTANDIITTTEHYQINRSGNVRFKHIPADASSKMPDEFMDALEPFNYIDMVPFQMSYMPGYLADKYDVSAEDNANRADVRMRNSAAAAIDSTVHGYETLVPERRSIGLRHDQINYAFFPIWMLTTQWRGKNYMFAMNGQTGKMIGDDLPVDYMKFFLYFIVMSVVLIAVIWLLFLR